MAQPITIPNGATLIPLNLSSSFKTVTLPVVSTNRGRTLIFKDMFGNAANSTIRLSTIGLDRIEQSNISSMVLSNAYGAWTFMNDGITNWFLTNVYLNTFYLVPTFLPTSISGLQLWLDATDSSTLNLSGSAVTQWNDKSGFGRNFTQATGSSQPTYGTFLSAPGISFTASQSLSNTYVQAGTGGRHTYLVFYDINTTADIYGNPAMFYMAFTASPSGGGDWRTAFSGASNYLGIDITGGAKLMNVTPNPTSMRSQRTIGLWAAPTSATVNTCYVFGNGTQFTSIIRSVGLTTAVNTVNTSVTRLGGGPNFVLSEVLHYSVELTTFQRQQVEGYLAWKWGLQGNLPAGHPYKNSPP